MPYSSSRARGPVGAQHLLTYPPARRHCCATTPPSVKAISGCQWTPARTCRELPSGHDRLLSLPAPNLSPMTAQSSADTPAYTPGCCANCGIAEVSIKTPLFCSEHCRQAAQLVRYVRACRSDGRDQLPDVKEAIQMRLAMVLGGGYPNRERRVPPDVRSAVFARSGGTCESCGRLLDLEGTGPDPDALATIQHAHGHSSHASNLKAFCRRCNMADARAKFVAVEAGSAEDMLAAQLRVRWYSPKPRRLCDDHERWKADWSGLARSARAVISARTLPSR